MRMFARFDAIHKRDGHTDRWTPHDGIGRACRLASGLQSRAKNRKPTILWHNLIKSFFFNLDKISEITRVQYV